MKVDLSTEAVTQRLGALNHLWELTVALQSSEIIKETPEN